MWEVMIQKLGISESRLLLGFLVLVLHSLFLWLSQVTLWAFAP